MRVYLPSTLPLLAEALAAGAVPGAPMAAFAVTPELREQVGGDEEELEYAALTAAADASLELLAAEPDAPRRRVVLAAEVGEKIVEPGSSDDPAAVTVTTEVPLKRVASAHVDSPDAAEGVAKAAESGDPEQADGYELLWYATQELPHLVE